MSSNSRQGPLPLSLGCCSEQVQHGHVCPFLNILHSTLPLAASVLVSFHCFLQDSFREGVMACYVSKPNQLSSPHCCQEEFLRAHNKVQDLLAGVFIFLAFKAWDTEQLPRVLGLKGLYSSFWFSQQCPSFTSRAKDGNYEWPELVESDLVVKLMVLLLVFLSLLTLDIYSEKLLAQTPWGWLEDLRYM